MTWRGAMASALHGLIGAGSRGLLVLAVCCGGGPASKQPETHLAASPATATSTVLPPAASDCEPEVVAYKPRPASHVAVRLPEVPERLLQPIRVGNAYTVWGAGYFLRSSRHLAEITRERVRIEGYIVKTNLPDAPRCAVHSAALAVRVGCREQVPSFWIGDTPNASEDASIKVMGWASSYAEIYDAIRAFDSGKNDEPYVDGLWEVAVPNPLPAVGAKVSVTGAFGQTFYKASFGAEADVRMGLLTYSSIHVVEPAAELATLPGVRRNRR